MSQITFHGGHFEGCQFGDHNSMQNYFQVVDKGKIDHERSDDLKRDLKQLRESIEHSDLEDDDKKEAVDLLLKTTDELQKPADSRSRSRLQRWLGNIKDIANIVSPVVNATIKIMGLLKLVV